MKKLIINCFIISSIISCNSKPELISTSDKIESSKINSLQNWKDFTIIPLKGYFLKNTITLPQNVNTKVFNSQEEFDSYFGIAKTMDNTIAPINFEDERVASILLGPTDQNIAIKSKEVKYIDKELQVQFEIIKDDKYQSYTTTPILLFKIPKNNDLTSIEFIHDNTFNTITFPLDK